MHSKVHRKNCTHRKPFTSSYTHSLEIYLKNQAQLRRLHLSFPVYLILVQTLQILQCFSINCIESVQQTFHIFAYERQDYHRARNKHIVCWYGFFLSPISCFCLFHSNSTEIGRERIFFSKKDLQRKYEKKSPKLYFCINQH